MVSFTAFDTTQTRNTIQLSGVTTWRSQVVTDVQVAENIPVDFGLMQNYPNPFNPSTTIRFSVGTYGHTSLRVYDVLGREVATLVNENLNAGSYEATFDAVGLASGVFFYRLESAGKASVKRLLLLR